MLNNFKKERTIVLVSMLFAMFLGYLPWYNFSAVSKYITDDLDLSVNQTGLILSSFQLGYVAIVLFMGWLADKIGNKKVIAWATLFTAISSTLFAFLAKDFLSVFALRLMTGLSAGAIYVPGVALLSSWYPPNRRSGVIGAYTAAMALAYAGGYFIAAPIAAAYSWRYGILATSLPAFLAAALVFIFVKDKKEDFSDDVSGETAPNLQASVPQNSPQKDVLGPVLITTGYMGHMWELYAFWGWIGPFLVACALASGYDTVRAVALGGQLAAFIILLGAPSVWLAGVVADRIGRSKTIIVCAVSSLLVEFVFGYLYGMSLTTVVLAGLWIGFWVAADSSIYKAGMTVMVSPKKRGTALGVQSALGFGVTIISPYVFGLVLERTNLGIQDATQATHWGLPFAILGLGALMAPISIILLKLYNNKKRSA